MQYLYVECLENVSKQKQSTRYQKKIRITVDKENQYTEIRITHEKLLEEENITEKNGSTSKKVVTRDSQLY